MLRLMMSSIKIMNLVFQLKQQKNRLCTSFSSPSWMHAKNADLVHSPVLLVQVLLFYYCHSLGCIVP
uniref:Putative ovule protein n=1 Tax=Solanum chacoense TaxID=4108 RepID=A0A0V0HGR9_SOLCH